MSITEEIVTANFDFMTLISKFDSINSPFPLDINSSRKSVFRNLDLKTKICNLVSLYTTREIVPTTLLNVIFL